MSKIKLKPLYKVNEKDHAKIVEQYIEMLLKSDKLLIKLEQLYNKALLNKPSELLKKRIFLVNEELNDLLFKVQTLQNYISFKNLSEIS